MMMKDSLFPAYFKCFRKGVLGWGEGPVVVMKDSLILLILNVLGRGCGPTNDDEGFIVSADFKCFRKGVLGWGRGPTSDDEGFFVSADFRFFKEGV